MQRTIQQITQRFTDRLPENEQYYRLDELRSWGFPSFLIRRIQIELERNLAESMVIPKTDWANTRSDAVQEAWQQFVDAIRAEARLPASYGQTVIETAAADVVEMLVQPRKNIPEVVFGTNEELSYDQVSERMKSVVVYRHFSQLIPRYMQKKSLDTLTKERCAAIISNADKKLTSRYSPLNWAQLLEPLFKLVDGDIDANLLRLFFEDKEMPRVARKFDLMNDSLSRAELIEVLSAPELLDDEEDGKELPAPSGNQTVTSSEPEIKPEADGEDTYSQESQPEELSKESQGHSASEAGDQEPASQPKPEEGEETRRNQPVQEEEWIPLVDENEQRANLQYASSEDQKEDEAEEEDRTKEDAGPERPSASQQAREKADRRTIEEADRSSAQLQEQETTDDEKEETPMWMRYMSDEEIEEYKKQEEEQRENSDGYIDEPIIDLTNEEASQEEIEKLQHELSVNQEFFVEEIFRGSERAFDEAVEDIAAYNSWNDVSRYIEEDIFERNHVDMYSEAAVDFTDQLQTYFLEKQNQNK